jgi:LPS-assembly protein
MTRLLGVLSVACLLVVLAAPRVDAQQLAGCQTNKQWTIDRLGKDHVKLIGQVEVNCGEETFFADEIEMFTDQNRMIATGNVVFTSGTSRIAAEKLDFNTQTKIGTFFNAAGSATLHDKADHPARPGEPPAAERSMFGTQEPDVYFYGATVEKIGDKTYRVTRGGFTTCLQPTPRWELTSGTVTVKLEHYALLTNSLFRVKGVPVLYLPVFYYPVRKDDRATGFLIPTYGTSSIRGQTLSNAFFWAINRSQDATFMHDWYSKTGQGYGSEYRYIRGAGSDGTFRFYNLREHGATYTGTGGVETVTPERTSYEMRGAMSQRLGKSLRARARVDYFSSLEVQQTYFMNVYDASRRQRTYSASLSGTWREYNIVGTYDHSEYFYGSTSSSLRGGTPRLVVNRGERPLFGSPVYFSLNGEFNHMDVERKNDTTFIDQGLTRYDLQPRIRVPFTKLSFLSVNSTAAFRTTYWSERRDASGTQIPDGISRNYYELQSNITGPSFNRIWNLPGNGYAEKLKHSIEPVVNLQRISPIENFNEIVQLYSVDLIIGRTTRVSYGVANRLFRKPRGGPSREVVSATIGQSYYTDARAAQYDQDYRTSNGTSPSKFSPLSITVRGVPTDQITANFRADYDTRYSAFRTMAADATVRVGTWLQSVFGWSQRRYIPELSGFNDLTRLDHYVNLFTNVRTRDNRFGGLHSFNYDVLHGSFLQQRVLAYYNAQCCGFAVEYQKWDLSRLGYSPIAQDHRLNFSFTLSGIGTFANPLGALGGAGSTGVR